MADNKYCLILAGGNGSRLWPISRTVKPKQFLDLFGTGRTLLQQTYDRVAKFIDPSHIYVSTNVAYLPLVYEQLPEVDDMHILEEPLRRGTLAAVAWGSVFIAKQNPQATLFVTPSDQIILKEEQYRQDVLDGLDFVGENNGLLVMGNEGNGISAPVEALVTHRLLIPPFPAGRATADSLNVAIATAICCSEFRRRQRHL